MRTRRALLSLAMLALVGAGCSSTPPPTPPPLSVREAQRSAAEAARWMEMDQWQAAAAEWERAGDLYALLNNQAERAVALHNQGQAQRRLGQSVQAAAALEEAARLNQSQDRQNPWWRNQIALLQLESDLGQTNEVDQRLATLGPQLKELTDVQLRAVFLNELGLRQMALREWNQAEATFLEARAGFEKAGDRSGLAVVTGNQARLCETRAQPETALALWGSALTLYEKLGDTRGIAQALEGQGRVLLSLPNRLPEAEMLLRRALRNYKLLSLPEAADRTAALLARTLEGQGKGGEAEGIRPSPHARPRR